jgi:hypothetical protein
MAFMVKTRAVGNAGPTSPGSAVLSQMIHIARASKALPQTLTEQLCRIWNGRCLIWALVGEVTTAIQNSDPVLKLSSSKLNAAGTAKVGTAYDIASTLNITSFEVGTMVTLKGDGTALMSPLVAGAGYVAATMWIAPGPGQIYITTGASKSGAMKWDIWYEPLDPGAYISAVDPVAPAILV